MPKRYRLKHNPIVCAVIFSIVACVAAVSNGVLAKYVGASKSVENSLSKAAYDEPSVSDTVVSDTDGYYYKQGVSVTVSECGYPVYVRVCLGVNWQSSDGSIYYRAPVLGKDYSFDGYDSTYWAKGSDGYYYYRTAVESGGTTRPLLGDGQKVKQLKQAPTGYTLHVEVLAETVQAIGTTDDGTTAVADAWGVQPDTLS